MDQTSQVTGSAAGDGVPRVGRRFGEDHDDRRALAAGLVCESADALRLASDLVADHEVRARLRLHADALANLSEASFPRASERPAHD